MYVTRDSGCVRAGGGEALFSDSQEVVGVSDSCSAALTAYNSCYKLLQAAETVVDWIISCLRFVS